MTADLRRKIRSLEASITVYKDDLECLAAENEYLNTKLAGYIEKFDNSKVYSLIKKLEDENKSLRELNRGVAREFRRLVEENALKKQG